MQTEQKIRRKIYRIQRTLEYTGTLDWILETLKRSVIQPGEGVDTPVFLIKETNRTEPCAVDDSGEEGNNGN